MQVERHREYETIYILRPNVDEQDVDKTIDRIGNVLESNGGHKLRFDEWGMRRLAYDIRDRTMGQYHDRGIFHYCRFLAPPAAVAEIERNLRIIEPVLKFMTVKIDDDIIASERLAAMNVEAASEAASEDEAAPEAASEDEAAAEAKASEPAAAEQVEEAKEAEPSAGDDATKAEAEPKGEEG
jgi:small subunit ribosomal protein S6